MRVVLDVVTMAGNQYVVYGARGFPRGELRDGEAPADGVKRIVQEWTRTASPKVELVDMLAAPGELTLLFRALLTEEPQGDFVRLGRMTLPERVGELKGKDVEEALKTSLSYKLTRA